MYEDTIATLNEKIQILEALKDNYQVCETNQHHKIS